MSGRIATSRAHAGFVSPTIRWRLLWLLNRPKAASNTLGIIVAALLLIVETVAVCSLNVLTGTAGRFGTLYFLGVVVISGGWGFWLSAGMSIASGIAFAYFHEWPQSSFDPLQPQNWLLLSVFVVIALSANALANLAQIGEKFFDLSPDLMCIIAPDRLIRINAAFGAFGYSHDEIATRPYLDFVDPEDRDAAQEILARIRDGVGEPIRFANRLISRDGSRHWIEWCVVWHRHLYYAVGRDITERRRQQDELTRANAVIEASRDELKALAEQQSALRHVATLVARGVGPTEVFSAVAEEMARCLNVDNAEVCRYDPDGTAVIVASYAAPGEPHLPVGDRVTLEGDNVAALVLNTGAPARIDDYNAASGSLAARLLEMGVGCRVGAPIVVDKQVWGTAVVGSSQAEPLPVDTEARIAEFADLVATAIAAATTRTELIASRARIVAAADNARRRLERDLHDGAQQRLVSLALHLRLTEESLPRELADDKRQLAQILSGLTAVSEDLREISRGIHPVILSKGGLSVALKTLARRSAVPVNLDVAITRRFADQIEVATYYVVAEALTNAAKHARASEVIVSARHDEDKLYLSIRDDGVGGADSHRGSGLIGLKDRVEALGGHLQIVSPPGEGTALHFTIPS
jgi:PAS domain S-box-containing protein